MRELDFDNLSEEDEAWLRNWNRGDEIPGAEGDEEDDEMVYDLTGLLKPQLQRQAELRDLDNGGTVAELQARIERHDSGEDEE